MRTKLFTTLAVDNIHLNPSSITAKTSFHGTSISVFQHPRPYHAGEQREAPMIKDDTSKVKRVPELPGSFTNVRPAHIAKNIPLHPKSLTLPSTNSIQSRLKEECAWLKQVCLTENVADAVSITVHHATQKRGKPFEVSISSLLPLILDQAHSIATIKHARNHS